MNFWHIGILTPDIEKTLDSFSSIPGVNRQAWTTGEVEFAPAEMLTGDGGRLRTAMGRVGGIVYELIQPLDDRSYHAAELKKKGPGPHHTAYVCEENLDAVAASCLAGGCRIVWQARHGGEHVYYIEAADGSAIWEFINCCPFMPGEE